MIKSFLEAKNEFDSIYGKSLMLKRSIVSIDGKFIDNISLKNKGGVEVRSIISGNSSTLLFIPVRIQRIT